MKVKSEMLKMKSEGRKAVGSAVVLALLSVFCFQFSAVVHADAPKVSGFIDTTYNYNFWRPASRITALRTFDRKTDNFLLNNAQVAVDGTFKEGEAGYRVELDFGTDPSHHKAAGTNSPNEPDYRTTYIAGVTPVPSTAAPSNLPYIIDVQEAYLTYKCPKSGVQLKMGKFVTFQGIEVIESKDNFTITRGHLFGLAEPFGHVGGVVGYAFPQVVDVWVGAVNGWDVLTDNNIGKTFVTKVGLNFGEKCVGALSFYRGAEKQANTNDARTSFDSTWFIKPIDKLTIGLQQNIGEEQNSNILDRNGDGVADGGAAHWYGLGIQPKVEICKNFSLGARYEWFSDLDGGRTGVPLNIVQNLTFAPTINMTETLMFRVEYRYDWGTRMIFETSDGMISKAEATTIGTEFVYKF